MQPTRRISAGSNANGKINGSETGRLNRSSFTSLILLPLRKLWSRSSSSEELEPQLATSMTSRSSRAVVVSNGAGRASTHHDTGQRRQRSHPLSPSQPKFVATSSQSAIRKSRQSIATDSNAGIVSSPTLSLSGMQNVHTGSKKVNPIPVPTVGNKIGSLETGTNSSTKPAIPSFTPRDDKVASNQSAKSAVDGKPRNNPIVAAPPRLCCDKCDGNHETDLCPYYKKKREDHPDAQKRSDKQMGGTSLLPGSHFAHHEARVIRQPGDGSCLFHSMSYSLGQSYNANRLRSEICQFINHNPNLLISETPLKDWVKWDTGSGVADYVRKMSRGSWGGGIEMACLSQMKQVNVHVYERVSSGYKRISAFDCAPDPKSRPVIRVLYCGGVHYGKNSLCHNECI